MRSVEVTAKTRQGAIDDALAQLEAERHEVEVEILDEGSAGIFGLGARPVKVRVTIDRDEPTTAKAASRPSQSQRQSVRTPDRPRGERPRERGRSDEPKPAPRRQEHQRREPRTARGTEATPPRPPARHRPAAPADAARPESEIRISPEALRERGNEAAAMLEKTIQLMGITATVKGAVEGDDTIKLIVNSEDSAMLIGRKGRTLNALQYLINRMVVRGDDDDQPERIIVDVEGYLDRRKSSLEDLATRMALKTKESGRRVRLKPLSPQERRIVHMALQDNPEVRTFSVGTGPARSIVIAPAGDDSGDVDERPRREPRPGGPRRGPARGGAPREGGPRSGPPRHGGPRRPGGGRRPAPQRPAPPKSDTDGDVPTNED